MNILRGWSAEVSPNHWEKGDVGLDSQDLLRILHENDIQVSDSQLERLPVSLVFLLMASQAEMLVLVQGHQQKLLPDALFGEKMTRAKADREAALGQIREHLGGS